MLHSGDTACDGHLGAISMVLYNICFVGDTSNVFCRFCQVRARFASGARLGGHRSVRLMREATVPCGQRCSPKLDILNHPRCLGRIWHARDIGQYIAADRLKHTDARKRLSVVVASIEEDATSSTIPKRHTASLRHVPSRILGCLRAATYHVIIVSSDFLVLTSNANST